MSLDTKWQVEQTWGSNQAVLKAVVEGLQPITALECGCGDYSTPLLSAGVDFLRSAEHDMRWVRNVKKRFPESKLHAYSVLQLAGVKNGTPHGDISPQMRTDINGFYEKIGRDRYDFVLVDTFRCARVAAAFGLMDSTGLIMLHDVEPRSREYYRYHELDNALADWHRYEHRPHGYINKVHQIPWTALYSRESLELDALQPYVIEESRRLWGLEVGLEEIDG